MRRFPFTFARCSLSFFFCCLGMSLAAALAGENTAGDRPDLPEGVRKEYAGLARSMRSEDLPGFMPVFHLDFIYEALDGSCVDRGPWRRVWLDRFERQDYDRVAFEPERVVKSEGERIVLWTRRVVVSRAAGSGVQRLQEALLEDTWVKSDDGWQLWYRKERELRIDGAVLPPPVASRRIEALKRDLKQGRRENLEAFSGEAGKGAPLIESGDGDHRWVTFLWRERGGEQAVTLRPASGEEPRQLARLGDTGLWYRTERIPVDARFIYEFRVETRVRVPAAETGAAESLPVSYTSRDPLDPAVLDGRSLVVMPGAPPLPWGDGDEVESELERHGLQSAALEERRIVHVFVPLDYDDLDAPSRLVILMGGETYASRKVTLAALEHLSTGEEIPPSVVVLIQSAGSRLPDLEFSRAFTRFVGEELLLWVRENYRVSDRREDCVIGGSGLGGSLAAYCALRYPGRFGGVLAHCGLFAESPAGEGDGAPQYGWLASRFAKFEGPPIRFHLEVGSLEPSRVIASSQHLRDVLVARGHPLTYNEFSGNRNSTTWHGSMARGLAGLLGQEAAPELLLETGAGEGPAWHPELGLLFSGGGDIRRLDLAGKSTVFRKGAGSNGLLFDRRGRLIVCEPARRRVTRMDVATGEVTVLTAAYGGKRYNQPNDVTVDSRGRIYFSDPRYGSRDGMEMRDASGREIEGVYRIDPDGSVTRIIEHAVDRPNGVLVSGDDRFLFVADNNNTAGGARKLWRFDLGPDGSIDPASRKLLFDWGAGRGPDGMVQDVQGRLHVAAGRNEARPPHETASRFRGGVYVLTPEGELLDFIPIPRDEVTNCTFGGADLRTLYITAGGTLWSRRGKVRGRLPWPAPE